MMTDREKLVELLDYICYSQEFSCYDLYDMSDAAESIADFLISKGVTVQGWISVKDRLPEDSQRVLFVPTCNQGSVYTGQFAFVGRDGGVMFAHRGQRQRVNYYAKYWMPLPEPPKEEAP